MINTLVDYMLFFSVPVSIRKINPPEILYKYLEKYWSELVVLLKEVFFINVMGWF